MDAPPKLLSHTSHPPQRRLHQHRDSVTINLQEPRNTRDLILWDSRECPFKIPPPGLVLPPAHKGIDTTAWRTRLCSHMLKCVSPHNTLCLDADAPHPPAFKLPSNSLSIVVYGVSVDC
ncbi:hypothetical protein HYPSUDRAFT_200836 [Hypholoma sublateritium FD-334 SS-4]|uniref:Uncharacterized protein n=1 Tax=Hypholoma sublateritium (strain FD-334 SS-4) TaxID=945553 RepID=A0A0D2MJY1_HYPSF|nr:hypothetical protein HYPSUDRAFT_200836 [Hypholoma sublateritium FD-334 SS-4]